MISISDAIVSESQVEGQKLVSSRFEVTFGYFVKIDICLDFVLDFVVVPCGKVYIGAFHHLLAMGEQGNIYCSAVG